MIGIYKITNPKGRVYIGQSVNIEKRKKLYVKYKCKHQPRLYISLLKYGFSEHIFEIIEECSTEELNTRERYWQDFYDVLSEKGLNCLLTPTNTQRKELSAETRKKIRDTNLQKGIMPPIRKKGYTLTQEHKDAIKQSNLKKIPWNKGKSGYSINRDKAGTPCKESTKDKISDIKSKYKNIECITTTGELIKVYKNMRELVQEGYNRDTVGRCIQGKLKKHKGFFWKIKQDE
jgi:group I intron endonuclease